MWHFTQPSSVESPALNCTQFSPDFSYPATHKQSVAESEPLLDSACGVHEAQVEMCVAAVTVLYVMLGHKLQSSDPIVFLYFPAEQSTHGPPSSPVNPEFSSTVARDATILLLLGQPVQLKGVSAAIDELNALRSAHSRHEVLSTSS